MPRTVASTSFLMLNLRYLCDSSELSLASHILLKGLPKTATSGDLRRAVSLAGVQGITDGELVRIPNHFLN